MYIPWQDLIAYQHSTMNLKVGTKPDKDKGFSINNLFNLGLLFRFSRAKFHNLQRMKYIMTFFTS